MNVSMPLEVRIQILPSTRSVIPLARVTLLPIFIQWQMELATVEAVVGAVAAPHAGRKCFDLERPQKLPLVAAAVVRRSSPSLAR